MYFLSQKLGGAKMNQVRMVRHNQPMQVLPQEEAYDTPGRESPAGPAALQLGIRALLSELTC